MPKFKGFKVIVMLCLVAFLFCGCNNFRLSSSIDDLISPISPSGDNAGVQSAVDEYCKGGYSIKIPATGKYTTSFILKDIDGDKISEAVAFYEPSNKIGTISMAVIKKSGDKWSVVSNIEGTATDVNCVDFCDFNNDGKMEIIVCWSVVSKLTGTSINVYSQKENNGAYSLKAVSKAITGMYLSGKRKIPVPEKRRAGNGKKLTVFGAQENNLKNIDVEFPLGKFIAVTGVSGSGKSSLVNEILYKYLANTLNGAKKRPGKFDKITGADNLDKVINIDQSPIGRTPRSNPATYTGVFNDIRELYAQTADAKQKGYKANRFSFNVKGGRCEACEGDGIVKIEMHFLADVYVPCEVCGGKRYNRETLEVKFKGKSIFDVLEMTVDEGAKFFEAQPKIYRKLKTLQDVGLGYIKIGQSATTLSGGEAQRVKLATELSKRSTGKTIYILDEPTTGLHTADVHRLTTVLDMLVNSGNTVVVIEHNLDIIKTADYIIDLGPEGGKGGGTIVATGTPEEIAACEKSYTGQYLKPLLDNK